VVWDEGDGSVDNVMIVKEMIVSMMRERERELRTGGEREEDFKALWLRVERQHYVESVGKAVPLLAGVPLISHHTKVELTTNGHGGATRPLLTIGCDRAFVFPNLFASSSCII